MIERSIILFMNSQIVRTQIKRFYSNDFVEYEKDSDPQHETGDDSENTVIITLIIIFLVFFVSPTTECLGPLLELNVSDGKREILFYF
jgi:sodium-coupled neutral amino acid transporter 11